MRICGVTGTAASGKAANPTFQAVFKHWCTDDRHVLMLTMEWTSPTGPHLHSHGSGMMRFLQDTTRSPADSTVQYQIMVELSLCCTNQAPADHLPGAFLDLSVGLGRHVSPFSNSLTLMLKFRSGTAAGSVPGKGAHPSYSIRQGEQAYRGDTSALRVAHLAHDRCPYCFGRRETRRCQCMDLRTF